LRHCHVGTCGEENGQCVVVSTKGRVGVRPLQPIQHRPQRSDIIWRQESEIHQKEMDNFSPPSCELFFVPNPQSICFRTMPTPKRRKTTENVSDRAKGLRRTRKVLNLQRARASSDPDCSDSDDGDILMPSPVRQHRMSGQENPDGTFSV